MMGHGAKLFLSFNYFTCRVDASNRALAWLKAKKYSGHPKKSKVQKMLKMGARTIWGLLLDH